MKAMLIAAIVALLPASSHADDVPAPASYALSFSINSDSVRLRRGPGTQFPIIRLLNRGTPVVAVQASDYDDTPEEDVPFRWYRCTLANNENVSGWVWGKYLSCRLNDTLGVLVFDLIRDARRNVPNAVRLYSFSNGEYVDERRSGEPLSSFAHMSVFKQSDSGIAVVGTVGDIERGLLANTIVADQYWPFAGYCTMTQRVVAPFFRDIQFVYASDRSTPPNRRAPELLSLLHGYVSGVFQEIQHKVTPFTDLKVDVERLQQFSVSTKGRSEPIEAYFCDLSASSDERTMWLTCFLTRQPDGSLVRTNVGLKTSPSRLPRSEAGNYFGQLSASVESVIDSADLPTSMVHVVTSGYESGRWDVYVTNGYVFYHLGKFWDGVE